MITNRPCRLTWSSIQYLVELELTKMSNQLTTIPLSELSKIKELLHKDFPNNIFGYGLICTAIEWCTKGITLDQDEFQVLTLNGGCKEDVLLVKFVSLQSNKKRDHYR